MSVRLKNRNQSPPGGFTVTISKLNQTKSFWSLIEAVAWYKAIADANPRLNLLTQPSAIADFIDQQNALRCLGIPGADAYVTRNGGQAAHAETKKAILLKPVVAVADKIRQLTAGAKVLSDWIGAGAMPVEQPEADRRANICARCPQNGSGDLTRWFTVPASREILTQIELATKAKLQTVHDDALGICQACLCPLKLKVHVPLEHIDAHLTPTARAALDADCWILNPETPHSALRTPHLP